MLLRVEEETLAGKCLIDIGEYSFIVMKPKKNGHSFMALAIRVPGRHLNTQNLKNYTSECLIFYVDFL